MKTKDFLFLNHHGIPNSTYIFDCFSKRGYDCDMVDETNIIEFINRGIDCKYRAVVLYLHYPQTIPVTDYIISNFCRDSVLIQHDDTDFEDVQVWSNRPPDLVMQREYTVDTKNPRPCAVAPFHFPWPSAKMEGINERPYDVSFIANMTNSRRIPFVHKLKELMTGNLKHLNWYVNVEPHPNTPLPWYDKNLFGEKTKNFKEIVNMSKVGLHYFGNSYDSHRIWELASVGTAILMPKMKSLSVQDGAMPFTEYEIMKDDFSDLEEKILYLLENERYKEVGQRAQQAYESKHYPEKCFEYYHDTVLKFLKSKGSSISPRYEYCQQYVPNRFGLVWK